MRHGFEAMTLKFLPVDLVVSLSVMPKCVASHDVHRTAGCLFIGTASILLNDL